MRWGYPRGSIVGAVILLVCIAHLVTADGPSSTTPTSTTTVQTTSQKDAENITAGVSSEEVVKEGMCPTDLMDPLLCAAGGTPDQCNSDSDCSGKAKCCSTGCAKVCIHPLFTACQHKKVATETRWRMLEEDGVQDPQREERMLGLAPPPNCNNDGDFQQVQCNGLDEDCWCIDSMGFEMPGTRARSLDLVNCSREYEYYSHRKRVRCPFIISSTPGEML